MVCELGLGRRMGPLTFEMQRAHSEDLARMVDDEMRELLEEATTRARDALVKNRAALNRAVGELLDRERLTTEDLRSILVPRNGSSPGSRLEDSTQA